MTGIAQSEQSRGFNKDDVCYYWIEAMPGAEVDGFIYVKFDVLSKVSPFVSIKKHIDDVDVTCEIKQDSIILLRHPYKLYLSFQSIN